MSITMTVAVCLIVILSTLFIAMVSELGDKLRTTYKIKYVIYIITLTVIYSSSLSGLIWLVNRFSTIPI